MVGNEGLGHAHEAVVKDAPQTALRSLNDDPLSSHAVIPDHSQHDRFMHDRKQSESAIEQLKKEKVESELDLHDLQQALDKAQRKNMRQAIEIDRLTAELNSLEESSSHTIRILQVNEASLNASIQEYQNKYFNTAAELTECKNALFDLQLLNQVPDTHVSGQWTRLCDNIVEWIDDEAGELPNLQSALDTFFGSDKINKRAFKAMKEYWDNGETRLNDYYPDMFENLIRYNIHRFLEIQIFDRNRTMVGLERAAEDFLDDVGRKMSKMETLKDSTRVAVWRSEALHALCSTQSYIQRRGEKEREITYEAEDFLGPLLPKRARGAFDKFERNIVAVAVKLDCMMRLSITSYGFLFGIHPQYLKSMRPALSPPGKGEVLFPGSLEMVDAVDIETCKKIRSTSNLQLGKDGHIGRAIMTIYPALYRYSKETRILLNKELILAESLEAPRRRG